MRKAELGRTNTKLISLRQRASNDGEKKIDPLLRKLLQRKMDMTSKGKGCLKFSYQHRRNENKLLPNNWV